MLSATSEIISPAGMTGTALQAGYFFALWCFPASLVRCWVCMLRKPQLAQLKQDDSQEAVSLIPH